jgi:acetyl-CoA synthetase
VDPIIWSADPSYIERANVTRFMRANSIGSYDELVSRSIDDIAWFWDAVVRDLDIRWFAPYETVVDISRGPEWATWFVGGKTNLALQCVDTWAERTPEATAVIWESEAGDARSWTYAQLRAQTDAIAHLLKSLGIASGDSVGVFMPMAPETVAVIMACSKIGAIWVPIFSGFGPEAVATRLADSRAKLLVTSDGSLRKGQAVPMLQIAERSCELVDRPIGILVWDRLGGGARWSEQLAAHPASAFPTEPLDAEHPLFIGYTSGTTGQPKGALHVHGGFLVKIAEEVAYQVDLHPGEVLHWVTDLGWIMGPWEIVGALSLGATVLLTEGVPTHPGPDRLWQTVERHGVTTLGVSPTLVRSLIPSGSAPIAAHDVSSLRILASTGEPLNPDAYTWLFLEIGRGRLPIINLSGGTEVGACFLSPLPINDLKACTLRGPALGMDVDVWKPDGTPAEPGEVGELVCKQPWPSMTRGVWGDRERYLDTYWRRWPGIWVHGDWAVRDDEGFWFLRGRSDDTLSVAGKRLGPAEVEGAVGAHAAVAESAAVGVPHPVKGEQIWCFVVLKPGFEPEQRLETEIKAAVAERLGKSFSPSRVVFVPALPKTRSAKIVRRAIKAVAVGEPPGDISSLEDPGALETIREAL